MAHFHYIMVGGMVTAFFAGLHFWWPKMTGRTYSEPFARLAALLMFVGFNATFFPQFILGYLGMPRRYWEYPEEFAIWNVLSSFGAVILGLAYLLPLVYLALSLRRPSDAGDNPWNATGTEWTTSSPPPRDNFNIRPTVEHEPYNYHARDSQPDERHEGRTQHGQGGVGKRSQ